jgi:lipocalin
MFLLNIFLLLSIKFIRNFNINSIHGSKSPDKVTELNVEQYLGNWYQIYGAPTNVIFQGYGNYLTAQY